MHPTILGLLGLTTLATARYAINLPPTLYTGPIAADYITPSLDQSDLDSPKLSHANASTFDWWHFDAIGIENPNATAAITFSNAGPDGYPLDIPGNLTQPPTVPGPGGNATTVAGHALWAHIWVTFEDGRRFSHVQAVESARMHGSGDSSVAIWHGAGGWMGSEEGYEVEFAVGDGASGVNVTGGISMERITSSHSRCSTASEFSHALEIGDAGLGWVAVMPDAIARVDVTVNGERLRFEGYGYHDKVWSSRPFTSSTKSLQRGRAHLGLYSVLWLSYASESNPGQEVVSSFLARDGESVNAGCADGSVAIVAGQEQTEGGLVSGFQVGIPGAQVSVATDIEDRGGRGAHVRWNGRARGMLEGVDEEGVAIFERFEY
ncbi:hypothetical protein ASPVEDRAFT_31400 [Aspergillus versicolor CBS 583.65]|uniref:AttH domain-containing protein n=1 Tax=Aspergillus versicolor CBS 583.65 TaxID=1036611 RepID=A0A1L9PTZ3_ASPVE|nr:uncharacterized protein ASPVEDRAFT_31400 [Aspergillus versicolor CBS 583.65]OJJ04981.1 hypothetical protein ASPVEDRAFT_31400 [Aspergillus versicolor CBS 583.65]